MLLDLVAHQNALQMIDHTSWHNSVKLGIMARDLVDSSVQLWSTLQRYVSLRCLRQGVAYRR